jgi:hypothetical protein
VPDAPKFHRYYDNMIPSDLCKRVIETFEEDVDGQHQGKTLGYSAQSSNSTLKDSTDIHVIGRGKGDAAAIWADIDDELYACVKESWIKYQEDVPSVTFLSSEVGFEDSGYQIQRYEPGVGKFGPHIDAGSIPSMFRFAAGVLYFNTVEKGGGTRFTVWDETVDAVEGRILWFPAGFTHVHEGLVPLSGRKYIASTFMCLKGYMMLDVNGPCFAHIMEAIGSRVPSAKPE